MYNPLTDFIGLWRNSGGATVSKLEMPGLDFVVAALARAGIVNVAMSATAPVVNQSTTAWLQTAVPDWNAEGVFYLWDAGSTAYAAATPELFFAFLEACAEVSNISLWTTTGGPPLNTVGHNGDYAIRTDDPGGIYGPKALGAWPADPLPGSSNIIESSALDNAFGANVGTIIFRGAAEWNGRVVGAPNSVLVSLAGVPEWEDLTSLLDAVFGDVQGSILFRGAAGWDTIGYGAENLVLTTHGVGTDPTWTPKSSEFPSGTVMLFKQETAPPGWTKSLLVDNCGLRVVSGIPVETPGSAFSVVFSQTHVGDTAISVAQMPSHSHLQQHEPTASPVAGGYSGTGNIGNPTVLVDTGLAGGDQAHNHTINLSLAYVDVIIATKD